MDKKQFDQLVQSGNSYAIIFSATWCVPCKAYSKNIDEVKGDLKSRIYKIDIDEENELAIDLNVMSVPVTYFIKNKHVEKTIGIQSKEKLINFLK